MQTNVTVGCLISVLSEDPLSGTRQNIQMECDVLAAVCVCVRGA